MFAQVSGSWDRLDNGRTRMLELAVSELEGPETVRLACTGRGCRKRASRTVKRHGRKLDFSKYVHGMVLHPKAKLTVTATRPGFVGRITTYTMVARTQPEEARAVPRSGGQARSRLLKSGLHCSRESEKSAPV